MPDRLHADDDQLLAYADGEPVAEQVAAHVGDCEVCGERLLQLQTLGAVAAARLAIRRGEPSMQRLLAFAQREWAQAKSGVPALVEALAWSRRISGGSGGALENPFGMTDRLVTGLTQVLSAEHRDETQIARAIRRDDPLCLVAAGECDEAPVATSPLWFTHLLQAPQQLAWTPPEGRLGPWHVRLFSLTAGDFLSEMTDGCRIDLSPALQARLPRNADLEWQIRHAGDAPRGPTVARAVFRLVPPAVAAEVQACLRDSETQAEEADRDFFRCKCLYASGLWDLLREHFERLIEKYRSGTPALLVRRGLAAVYDAVDRELNGNRMMGEPEGAWARAKADAYLKDSYAVISVPFPS